MYYIDFIDVYLIYVNMSLTRVFMSLVLGWEKIEMTMKALLIWKMVNLQDCIYRGK